MIKILWKYREDNTDNWEKAKIRRSGKKVHAMKDLQISAKSGALTTQPYCLHSKIFCLINITIFFFNKSCADHTRLINPYRPILSCKWKVQRTRYVFAE